MASRMSTPIQPHASQESMYEGASADDDDVVVIVPARQDVMREAALRVKEARLVAKEALDAKKSSEAQVEALKKELKAAQDDAVRARLRGASLFEDNMNQKKENQELKKKHDVALAEAHNLRQSLDVFKRIKCELEVKIVELKAAAQALKATPVKKGKEPAAWAVKGFEQMMAFTDVRPQRQHYAVATGAGSSRAGPSASAPSSLFDDLPDDAFPEY